MLCCLDINAAPCTFAVTFCRYDGIWQEGVVKCGSYSEVQPAPAGALGALPCIELCSPAAVLQEGATAALGLAS
jgi:hypothetical protein